jgi:hypothetical protein
MLCERHTNLLLSNLGFMLKIASLCKTAVSFATDRRFYINFRKATKAFRLIKYA